MTAADYVTGQSPRRSSGHLLTYLKIKVSCAVMCHINCSEPSFLHMSPARTWQASSQLLLTQNTMTVPDHTNISQKLLWL